MTYKNKETRQRAIQYNLHDCLLAINNGHVLPRGVYSALRASGLVARSRLNARFYCFSQKGRRLFHEWTQGTVETGAINNPNAIRVIGNVF